MSDSVRLDKWLWAARFYKTRSQAGKAISGGKVHLNSDRTKPGRAVRVDAELRIRKGTVQWTVIVREISDKRGPAEAARQLYEETEESVQKREQSAEQLKIARQSHPMPVQKPTKKQRRELEKFLRRNQD